MNRAYYYFAASLPMLSFEAVPPVSPEDFLSDCRRLLHPDDASLVESLFSEDPAVPSSRNHILNRWLNFEGDLRNEFAWVRARAAGREAAKFMRKDRSSELLYAEIVSQAFKEENLLEGQKLVDRYRWRFLEGLEAGEVFTFGFIVIYALKLRILARYDRIDSSEGAQVYEAYHHGTGERLSSSTGVAHDIAETIKS